MKSRFSRLEARVEALVEGTFARLFAGRIHPQDVAIQLARALEDSAAAGRPATRYTVRLNPADAQALLSNHPHLAETLAAELVAVAREAQLTLPDRPEVIILPDAVLRQRSLTVAVASTLPADLSVTHGMTPVPPGAMPALPRAFLIVHGERTVPLTLPLVNLGRRLSNQIVLDDSRVSRAHAQLRLRFGRYVIYDLGSSGGTFVNGKRVAECVLRPGDVIALNGVPLIYGEEEADAAPSSLPRVSRQEGGQTKPSIALEALDSPPPSSSTPPADS